MTRQKHKTSEERRSFFKPTERAAPEVIESEVEATRKKTANLKAQRLAKKAAEKR